MLSATTKICFNKQETLVTSHSNTVKQKPRNVALFIDSMFRLLCMKEFNKNLNGGIVHLKLFPGSKTEQMDHHTISNLKGHQHDAAAIHVGINDLLKSHTNINANEIGKDIVNIA